MRSAFVVIGGLMGTEAAQHDATFRHLTRREDLRGVAGQAAEVIVTRPLAVDNSVIPGRACARIPS